MNIYSIGANFCADTVYIDLNFGVFYNIATLSDFDEYASNFIRFHTDHL